jgi:hypothetical protein
MVAEQIWDFGLIAKRQEHTWEPHSISVRKCWKGDIKAFENVWGDLGEGLLKQGFALDYQKVGNFNDSYPEGK